MDHQQKNKTKKIIFVSCIVISALFIFGFFKEMASRTEVSKKVKTLNEQIRELETNNAELESMISSFQGNEYIEKEARLKLGMQKPGEKAVLIKREDSAEQDSANDVNLSKKIAESEKIISNPRKWLNYFFK